MSFRDTVSSPSPAPVAQSLGGEHVFSSTTTSHPAAIRECAHEIPAMLPPTTTAFPILLPPFIGVSFDKREKREKLVDDHTLGTIMLYLPSVLHGLILFYFLNYSEFKIALHFVLLFILLYDCVVLFWVSPSTGDGDMLILEFIPYQLDKILFLNFHRT